MFTEHQLATLRALVNRIIPADEFPAGWEAGVGTYLLRQFDHDLRPLLTMYHAGLDALDDEARALHGVGFAELGADAQDALLTQIEENVVATPWSIEPVVFFRYAVAHAAEGYYSDPGNGGNRDGVAWQMIGFEVNA